MEITPDCKITSSAEAHAAKLSATKLRLNLQDLNRKNKDPERSSLIIANNLDKAADAYLILDESPRRGIAGEFVQTQSCAPFVPSSEVQINRTNIDASLDRLELVHKNGVLNMALDTAESLGVTNAAEQMITHQMAAAHRMCLDLMTEAGHIRDPIEMCRVLNTATKLMDACQKGLSTIHKVRNGGQQTVTVQHVQVTDGGQAVINGAINKEGAK